MPLGFRLPSPGMATARRSSESCILDLRPPRLQSLCTARLSSCLLSPEPFLWAIAVTVGALAVFYAVTCAAMIRLRRSQPAVPAFRLLFGPVFAVLGIVISVGLLTQLELHQLWLMTITSLLAAGNWLWARANAGQEQRNAVAVLD